MKKKEKGSMTVEASISVCYDFNWLSGADDSVSG